MTTFEAIMALIEEDVRCDIHGDLYGHERVAEHLADYIDGYVNRIEQLEAALRFYRDGFYYHPKRTVTGVNVSEWLPTEELLNDCGENARAALAGEKKDG